MVNKDDIVRLAHQGLLEESIADLYDNAPCGYFSTLPNGTFIKINHTFLRWLGYEEGQLLYQKKLQDLLSIGDSIYYETHYYPLLQMQGFVNEINFSLRTSAGRLLPVLLNTLLVQDAEGKPALFRTTVFDITDRKKYELELLRAKKKAEEAARVKAEFLSTVSHEIRTPMNAIVGIAHLLRKTALSPQQAEYLNILEVSTDNLLKLINNILDFSKIEAGKVSLLEESIRIRELIGAVVQGFEARAQEKGLRLRYTVEDGVPELVMADALKLGQVLNNLVGNAIKFTKHGQVNVRVYLQAVTQHTATLTFEVADTGIGIAPDKMGLIFEDFAQANAAIDRTYGGTGLGLAISRRLLALYRSELQVESEVGKGSRFFFDLSLRLSSEKPRQQPVQTKTNAVRGLRLLLVEDNKINVYVLSQYLQHWGVAFEVAGNGQEALEKVARQHYDLVLMDLQMPVMDGYEAARRIRSMEGEKYKKLPIIALTASAKADYEEKLAVSGMDGILPKPFNPDLLLNLLSTYCAPPASEFLPAPPASVTQPHKGEAPPYDLSTFQDLMADDPEGMHDIISLAAYTFKEANTALVKASRERNGQQFALWVQKLQTSLELLQAKPLKAILEQGLLLLKAESMADPDLLVSLEQELITQFQLVLEGLEEQLKPIN